MYVCMYVEVRMKDQSVKDSERSRPNDHAEFHPWGRRHLRTIVHPIPNGGRLDKPEPRSGSIPKGPWMPDPR